MGITTTSNQHLCGEYFSPGFLRGIDIAQDISPVGAGGDNILSTYVKFI